MNPVFARCSSVLAANNDVVVVVIDFDVPLWHEERVQPQATIHSQGNPQTQQQPQQSVMINDNNSVVFVWFVLRSVEQCDHDNEHEPHVDVEVATAEERVIDMGSMNHIHAQSQAATGVTDQQLNLHNQNNHQNNHNNHQVPIAPSSPASKTSNAVNTIATAATVTAVSNSINSNTVDGSPSAFEDTNTTLEMILVNSSLENVGVGGDNDNNRLPDVVAETKIFEPDSQSKETYFSIAIQVFIPFLIAGFGMVGAGLVLDVVQVGTQLFFPIFSVTTWRCIHVMTQQI